MYAGETVTAIRRIMMHQRISIGGYCCFYGGNVSMPVLSLE